MTLKINKIDFQKFNQLLKKKDECITVQWCYRFAWQGFGSGWAIGVASVRSCEKLPPCLTEPVPAGSKTDPPLAKAKPISDGGSASVVTDLRRGRKICGEMAVEREE